MWYITNFINFPAYMTYILCKVTICYVFYIAHNIIYCSIDSFGIIVLCLSSNIDYQ